MTLKSLKALDLATKDVELPGGVVTVRGLALDEIVALAKNFQPSMATIFQELVQAAASVQGQPSITMDQATLITANLITEAPGFVRAVIVLGCSCDLDDEVALETARRLDAGSQVALVGAIAELTFAAVGGMGNAARLLVTAFAGKSSPIPFPKA